MQRQIDSSNSNNSSNWVAGVYLDSSSAEVTKILEAFDTNIIYSGLSSRYTLLEILFKDGIFRVKSPNSEQSIITSEKVGTYIVKVEGDYKVSRGTILLALISAVSILYCIGSAPENTEKREEL